MLVKSWLLLIAIAFAATGRAEAAISTFPVSVFQTGGTGSANLVGNTAATARLNRNQTIGLNYGADINQVLGSRLFFNITAFSNNTTYVWVRLGNWNGSTFTSAAAAGQTAPNGAATTNIYAQVTGAGVITVFLDPFFASCQAIGGCNALVFGNSTFSAVGSFYRISTLVAATPEPSTWIMMMLGFAGVALRMKAARQRLSASSPIRQPSAA
jgi:hypothetical protein